MKKNLTIIAQAALIAGPLIASAATIFTIGDLLTKLSEIIAQIIPFLIAVAVLVFLFGVVKYITAAGDEEKVKEGRKFIVWGIVGLFIMVAVWGFVNLLVNTIELDTAAQTGPTIPPIPR